MAAGAGTCYEMEAPASSIPPEGACPLEKHSISWADVERLVGRLLARIPRDYDNILVITRGGMVPACLISERANIRNILCAAVIFYDETQPALPAPMFVQFPSDDQVHGRRILVEDSLR